MLENYSKQVKKILKNIKIGDRISVTRENKTYEGFLMPKTDTGDADSIVIKLDNGYNISIKYERGVKVEKVKKPSRELGKETFKKLEFDSSKPKVAMISTGGTIASKVDYRTGGVYALETSEELLSNIPELKDIVYIKDVSSPLKKMSEDIGHKDWQIIAKEVAKHINNNKGVIITHGTDTMHYTSAALSFMLKDLFKPVVLVGSQRSSDRGSTDSFMNLICAAYVSISDIGEVGICMHGTTDDHFCYFIRGSKARKMHTSRRDAFRSINEIPLARIFPEGKVDILNKNHKKRDDSKEVVADTKFESKVALLKVYPGSDPEILEMLVKKKYKGFVLEGTGLGHVPTFADKSWIPTIKKIIKDGIPVVIAPQTIYGRINTRVYTNLRILYNEAKAIPSEDMLPETAYVKLGWLLGHTKNIEEIRKLMTTNITGEISERSTIDSFLV